LHLKVSRKDNDLFCLDAVIISDRARDMDDRPGMDIRLCAHNNFGLRIGMHHPRCGSARVDLLRFLLR